MRTVFRLLACLTLLADAYLLLALLAVGRMKAEYHGWLPPFGSPFAGAIPASVYAWVVAWTGTLAVGLLVSTRDDLRDGDDIDASPTGGDTR